MDNRLFDINNFNIIQDEENYYFFRALNMADNSDIEQEITKSSDGKIERIRTDRERFEGDTKYTEDSSITLEEVYDHIKMHYRKDTNCVSLTSNANIAINYGRGSYTDKYVMIKIPKKEFGKQTVQAGQYMLQELYSRIKQSLEELPEDLRSGILDIFSDIDVANETKELQEIMAKRYTAQNGEVNPSKAHPRKGISYSSPKARISSYQSLDEGQLLEVNKVYAKLAVLENEEILKHVIPHSSNSKLRETIGNAFSSSELIHYGEIRQSEIFEIPKENVDLFALIQQINGIDKSKVEEIKRALLVAIQSGKEIPQIPEIDFSVKDNISIEEMYELTGGTVEYGKANSIVKNMFYLSKARQNAIKLSEVLKQVLGNDSRFDDLIEYIRENGFRIEPEIISRKSGKGVKLSESVNLNLSKDEQALIDEIKKLSYEELELVLQNGGLTDLQNIAVRVFSKNNNQIGKEKNQIEIVDEHGRRQQIIDEYGNEFKTIEKSRYYAEAIISQYDWNKINIEEFKISERNELIKRLQERNCIDIYNKLKQAGIEERLIPIYLLNIATRDGFYEQYENGKLDELLSTRQDVLSENINIEVVERFLGYYDVEGTGIKLKDYQQRAFDNVNELFKDHKFAQVILPTGAGKSFVAIAQMVQYAKEHPNEEMLYLAPQDEILNQIKSYIIKYVHGKQGTVGKTEDEIISEVFPNITFETYSGLLAKRGQEVIKEQYGMIILDELHRTGAKEWEGKIDTLLESQNDDVKVFGITATPVRDVDGRDMAEKTAKKLGYTEEVKKRKHLASNMTLENAIRMGYVVNPKLVYCKYDLISSGKMDELRAKIDDIEDENKREEELQKYNELRQKINKEIDAEIGEEARKKLEEDTRKNLDSGIGKEEILRQHVKKGGKYIVFIPVTDQGEIEDENGNRIGSKTGEDKIKAYQEYLNKVFEGTEIKPQLHSLLGSYSKDKNKEELEAFESDNSDETKFMVVMNKANEGLHIDGVDGIIWFRALDENSRILYLQQLGRAIYALDEDNPLPDDKRPVIIDLANNTLTVKMEKAYENIEPIDDLESLKIIIEWINKHDGMIPNRESSNKQEQHYYAVLRRIQAKYSKYLDGFDELEELDDEEKSRIEEIIELASEIDLWNMDLPPISKTKVSKKEWDPFTVEGVLKDLVEFEDEIDEINLMSESLKNILRIEEWCERNFKNVEIWNRRLPVTSSQDEEEKRLGECLFSISKRLKRDIQSNEDEKIREIFNRVYERYAFGKRQLNYKLGQTLEIKNWCEIHFKDADVWNRRLPSKTSNDSEERRLARNFSIIEDFFKKESKMEGDIRIQKIIEELKENYGFAPQQSRYWIGQARKVEIWCKLNYDDKEKWDRKLPSPTSKESEEKEIGLCLMHLKAKLKEYENMEKEKIETDDMKAIEILNRVNQEYAYGLGQPNYRYGQLLKVKQWCEKNAHSKEKWNRCLPKSNSKNKEERELAYFLSKISDEMEIYLNNDEIENEKNHIEKRELEVFRYLKEEYAYGNGQCYYYYGQALKILDWCKRNFNGKSINERRTPLESSNDEEERKLGNKLKGLRKKKRQYKGKATSDIENDADRKMIEILDEIESEYNTRNLKIIQAQQKRNDAKRKNTRVKEIEKEVSEQLKKRGQAHEEQ